MQQPHLTDEQQVALFHAVGRYVVALVTKTRGPRLAEQVPDVADIPLLGAFVSLKKNGELRSCMGTMSDEIPLASAVEQAAIHAAQDDPRFPPITPAELFELELEIWLLWGMQRVAERGRDRINAIEIGRHGVQIARGGNRGLLLPGVAVEHNMDAEAFLEAVCRKAGLPTDAWLDDRSLLHQFEGRSIRGPLSATENMDKKAVEEIVFAIRYNKTGPQQFGPTLSEIQEVRQACAMTFRSMAEGVAPSTYFAGLFDGNVSGVSLTLQLPERPPLICSKISMRPDLPFQVTVIELLRTLGRQAERFAVTWPELQDSQIELTVFWDPRIHGNANRHDLGGLDMAARSLLLSSPQGWTVRFAPAKMAETVLQEAVQFLDIPDNDLGEVISFATLSTARDLTLTSVTKPNRGQEIRPPAVVGMFYPGSPEAIQAELVRLLSDVMKDNTTVMNADKEPCVAAMIPHAGWSFSGRLAAQTLARIAIPRQTIIFAPKHHSEGALWAVAPHRAWAFPGRTMESDHDLAASLVQAVDFFEFDAAAHARDHAIEVQLPLLAHFAPETKIVCAALGMSTWAMIQKAADQFATLLETLPEWPLLLVSSDMNHFQDEETTRKLDRVALNAIRTAVDLGKPERAFEAILKNNISMCGVIPMIFVLETLRRANRGKKLQEVDYTTSADVSGDTSRVVGYAGLLFQ